MPLSLMMRAVGIQGIDRARRLYLHMPRSPAHLPTPPQSSSPRQIDDNVLAIHLDYLSFTGCRFRPVL